MTTKNEKIAAVYCRVSTDEQAKEGLSLEAQVNICTQAAERDGYTVAAVLKDEGKSGGTMKRAGIQEIVRLISGNLVNVVYTLHSDRIARNTLDYLVFRQLLRDKGVLLKCVQQPMLDDESASGRTMDTVLASFNEMQKLVTSDKVKATLYAKVQAGYFPTVPSPGYINADNPDPHADRLARKIIVPDPIAAPLITELFKLYATGVYSVYDLTDMMNERGLRSHKGYKLSPSRVYELLRNRMYLGEVKWGKAFNKNGKHKPLIDEATFDQVQIVLETNNHKACRRRKYQWLLSGFVYCAHHAKRYVAEWH